jgi:hypothetical protein
MNTPTPKRMTAQKLYGIATFLNGYNSGCGGPSADTSQRNFDRFVVALDQICLEAVKEMLEGKPRNEIIKLMMPTMKMFREEGFRAGLEAAAKEADKGICVCCVHGGGEEVAERIRSLSPTDKE